MGIGRWVGKEKTIGYGESCALERAVRWRELCVDELPKHEQLTLFHSKWSVTTGCLLKCFLRF